MTKAPNARRSRYDRGFSLIVLALAACSTPPGGMDAGDGSADTDGRASDALNDRVVVTDTLATDARQDVASVDGSTRTDVLDSDGTDDVTDRDSDVDAMDAASADAGSADSAIAEIAVDSATDVTGDTRTDSVADASSDVASRSFAIGGTLRGLTAGSITLRNNGGDDLVRDANGAFRFATSLPTGAAYAVTVATVPMGQRCAVTSGGAGTVASADVSDVLVDCTPSGSRTFGFTGAPEAFVVPLGVTSVVLELWGAEGQPNENEDAFGGSGGYALGTLDVTPGATITVRVGGQSGFNGGGLAGVTEPASAGCRARGGNGGGATDVRIAGDALSDRVLVAAGGGGAGGGRARRCAPGSFGYIGGGGGGGGGYFGGGGGGGVVSATFVLHASGGTQTAGGIAACSTTQRAHPRNARRPVVALAAGCAVLHHDDDTDSCAQCPGRTARSLLDVSQDGLASRRLLQHR